uniref:Fork-head domain-containing protein n=1 Tax=Monopterus albus TaxID=43700 RepID=A0A3Q3KA46_MONAL|nr:forkhead box protein O1-A-like [Monopterus albus]XP_020454557.1 forkhead box protein O1-A-like [Monopterus albus]
MAQVPRPEAQLVEIDPDFEPLSRPRSCTWPLPRPEFIDPANSNTSSPAPSVKQEPGGNTDFVSNLGLLEEDYEEYTEQKPSVHCNDFHCREGKCAHLHHPHHHHHVQQQLPGPQLLPQQQVPAPGVAFLGNSGQRKSSSSRRNAWGNMSYADLITKAIDSSPEKRLTLSQIYDWMVKSVPYFKDKGDSNSSAGWKNSIRHNLSLHSRFVRIQNEGTGKSSWWMLNPDGGKNGKSPRRRAASMDNNNKFAKLRGKATKKKVALQEGVEAGAGSPGSQYSTWLGSPNEQGKEDCEAWSSFRTRTSSDASTLSGHHSPFPSEQDDLGESDGHMMYPGAVVAKITSTLPSLSEVAGSMGQHGSENVMESLLDNLNLLSPKNPQLGSDSSNSTMLQSSPYSSSGLSPHPQQAYHKCAYGQVRMNSLSSSPMQTLPETKLTSGAYEKQYIYPAGLLKELLTADADASRDMMPSRDTLVTQVGRGGCLMPIYSSQSHVGGHNGMKMMNSPQRHPIPHVTPQAAHNQGPSTSKDLNSCNMIPLSGMTSLSGATRQMTNLRTRTQLPRGHPAHTNDILASYSSSNGYRELNLVHPHGRHQERLPSDLDNMSIERLECDMESVLHDTLMDGGALDFNFDPTAGPHGFSQRVKTNTHSWVSG